VFRDRVWGDELTAGRGAVIILYGGAMPVPRPDHADTERINRVQLGTPGSKMLGNMKPPETS
jgi:hypothetical protein